VFEADAIFLMIFFSGVHYTAQYLLYEPHAKCIVLILKTAEKSMAIKPYLRDV
jgi:hypothetical protein